MWKVLQRLVRCVDVDVNLPLLTIRQFVFALSKLLIRSNYQNLNLFISDNYLDAFRWR